MSAGEKKSVETHALQNRTLMIKCWSSLGREAMRQATAICLLVLASALAASGQDKEPTPPAYCNPCLFYGGDFDANGPSPNVLLNQDALINGQAVIYVPFAVPPNQVWTVTGLFSNDMVTRPDLSPPQIQWSISTGISQGNAGTVIASGVTKASLTATGRTWNGLSEYTALGLLNADELVTLTPGHYWMTAVPVCTSNVPPHYLCGGATYYLSDVEDVPAPEAKGFESTDESYWDAPGSTLYNFVETGGPTGICNQEGGGGGCDKFSAGLLGTAQLN
jgi:hypothetical protein